MLCSACRKCAACVMDDRRYTSHALHIRQPVLTFRSALIGATISSTSSLELKLLLEKMNLQLTTNCKSSRKIILFSKGAYYGPSSFYPYKYILYLDILLLLKSVIELLLSLVICL